MYVIIPEFLAQSLRKMVVLTSVTAFLAPNLFFFPYPTHCGLLFLHLL